MSTCALWGSLPRLEALPERYKRRPVPWALYYPGLELYCPGITHDLALQLSYRNAVTIRRKKWRNTVLHR